MTEDAETAAGGPLPDRAAAQDEALHILLPDGRTTADLQAQLNALRAELEATNARWSALYQTAVMFTRRALMSDILEQVVRHCMDLLQADQGILLEYSPATDDLVIRTALSANGDPPLTVGRRVKAGEGLTGLAWQTGQIQVVDEYHSWPGRLPDARVPRTHAAIAVPLIGNRGAVGALGMAFEQEGRRITGQDRETLHLFAQQAAAILDVAAGQRLRQELAVRAERRRLARQIHDGMQQRLAALLLKIDWCESQLKEDQEALYDGLETIAAQIHALIDEMRSIASVLHETELSGRGLYKALNMVIAEQTAESGLEIHLDAAVLNTVRLSSMIEVVALRLVREGLNNAWRHGRATEAHVELSCLPGSRLRVSVADNGSGIVPPPIDGAETEGFGLASLRQQIEALGGRFGLDSAPNCGATLWAELPTEASRPCPSAS